MVALLIAITLLHTAADGVQPALQSYWLVIHVSVASLATGLFCVGAALSVLQLVRGRDERRREAEQGESGTSGGQPVGGGGVDRGAGTGSAGAGAGRRATLVAPEPQPTEGEVASIDLGGQEPQVLPARPTFWSRLLDAFPAEETLERLSYRLNAVGLVGWTFVLITGSIWAEYAWGRAWGWDPKEVVSLVVWIIYAAYCHVRLTTGWSKKAFAYFSLAGFAALMFNYYGVNIFINSLHSYAGV